MLLAVALAGGAASSARAQGKLLYQSDFAKADLEKAPEDPAMMILDGGFVVKQEGTNKFLELPGAPLDSYGIVFGPSRASGVVASARVFSTRKGRRFPTFGVGVNGGAGFRLQMTPAKDAIELYKGDDAVASKEFKWTSGEWHTLKIRIVKAGDGVKVDGKIWLSSAPEPSEWLITAKDAAAPTAGKSSIWGKPFAGTPIRYDDLKVFEAE